MVYLSFLDPLGFIRNEISAELILTEFGLTKYVMSNNLFKPTQYYEHQSPWGLLVDMLDPELVIFTSCVLDVTALMMS